MSLLSKLTERERQTCDLIVKGYSRVEAGDLLCLSPRTIERHLHYAYKRLKISSELQLMGIYVRDAYTEVRRRIDSGRDDFLEPLMLVEEVLP